MWTCWICSWLTYQQALFSSLRETLNIHRLYLSVAATDSFELLGEELRVCVCVRERESVGFCLSASVCLRLTGVFVCPPVCVGVCVILLGSYLVLGQVHWAMVGRASNCWFSWPVDDTEREREMHCESEQRGKKTHISQIHLPWHTHTSTHPHPAEKNIYLQWYTPLFLYPFPFGLTWTHNESRSSSHSLSRYMCYNTLCVVVKKCIGIFAILLFIGSKIVYTIKFKITN